MSTMNQDLQAKLVEAMGPLPPKPDQPPSYRVIAQTEKAGYLRQEIEYDTDGGPSTPAFLLIPHDAESAPAPAVLSLHGTHIPDGHRTTVGLAGKPNRDYGHRMAEQGFVVLAPAYPTMGGYDPDFLDLGYRSGTMKAISDNIRGIDLLASLPQVAGERVGAVGLSLGGHNALFTAAFEPRIVALAAACSFDSFRDYRGGDVSPWTQDRYMPRLTENGAPPFDFDDVLALLSDRALFVNAPVDDHNFQWWSVARLIEDARPTHTGALEVVHPECGHEFPYPVQDQAFAFLRSALVGGASHG